MSYGTNAPQGLQVYKYLNGSTWTGQNGVYLIASSYATSLFTGDPITLLSDGTIGIGAAALTAAIIGSFNGCVFTNSTGTVVFSPYWPASTATQGTIPATGFVIDDPNVIFNIQATLTISQTDLNSNYGYTVAAGSTVTGQSGYSLDIASGNATTNTLKLIALTPAVNNPAFGTNYNNGLVLINNHIYKGGTGTAGV